MNAVRQPVSGKNAPQGRTRSTDPIEIRRRGFSGRRPQTTPAFMRALDVRRGPLARRPPSRPADDLTTLRGSRSIWSPHKGRKKLGKRFSGHQGPDQGVLAAWRRDLIGDCRFPGTGYRPRHRPDGPIFRFVHSGAADV